MTSHSPENPSHETSIQVTDRWSKPVLLGDLTHDQDETSMSSACSWVPLDLTAYGIDAQPTLLVEAQVSLTAFVHALLQPLDPKHSYLIDERDLTLASREQKMAEQEHIVYRARNLPRLVASVSQNELEELGLIDDKLGMDPSLLHIFQHMRVKISYPGSPHALDGTLVAEPNRQLLSNRVQCVGFIGWAPADLFPLPTLPSLNLFSTPWLTEPGYSCSLPVDSLLNSELSIKVRLDPSRS